MFADTGGLVDTDPSLAHRILDLPWFADGLTDSDDWALTNVLGIAKIELSLAYRLLDAQWLGDDVTITPDKYNTLVGIRRIAAHDLEIANILVNIPGFDGRLRTLHGWVARGIASPSLWKHLVNQPWVRDGLTDEEAAKIVVLTSLIEQEELFQDMIQGGYVLSETFSSPLAGELNLFVVSRSPLQRSSGVFEGLRSGIEAIEDFIGAPWPDTDVIVLLEPESELTAEGSNVLGANAGSHIVMKEDEGAPTFRSTL